MWSYTCIYSTSHYHSDGVCARGQKRCNNSSMCESRFVFWWQFVLDAHAYNLYLFPYGRRCPSGPPSLSSSVPHHNKLSTPEQLLLWGNRQLQILAKLVFVFSFVVAANICIYFFFFWPVFADCTLQNPKKLNKLHIMMMSGCAFHNNCRLKKAPQLMLRVYSTLKECCFSLYYQMHVQISVFGTN